MGGGRGNSDGGTDFVEYIVAGCGAAAISRTCIAPIERVKIIFQTSKSTQRGNWLSIIPDIWRKEGLVAFWKGNNIAVIRVMPYLSVQLASNEFYRSFLQRTSNSFDVGLSAPIRNLVSGGFAGATAVAATYPLDTVRARLALLSHQSSNAVSAGMAGTVRHIWVKEGVPALYRGCLMSCYGGGVYCAIKFMTYDMMKAQFHRVVGVKSDKELRVWQRACSGAVGGLIAQTVAYPVDLMRRRMQTARGPEAPYRGIVHGVITIAKDEGIVKGLYRGLSLNYFKTIPNVAIYLSLYDCFKYWLLDFRGIA